MLRRQEKIFFSKETHCWSSKQTSSLLTVLLVFSLFSFPFGPVPEYLFVLYILEISILFCMLIARARELSSAHRHLALTVFEENVFRCGEEWRKNFADLWDGNLMNWWALIWRFPLKWVRDQIIILAVGWKLSIVCGHESLIGFELRLTA